ncbi:hypothetical protein Lalb_Chr19g0139521 [Lupinus albus]|uniref:Uncharacterized protein n=1 Tax=Lupinus albus TaxID=3870 RepID=A0A6A4P471_LUPAL|nr:hypothetical protein Lalb_Chr19g0139521 [Lupinus albus]
MENSGWLSGLWSMRSYEGSSEGSSPWGVAAFILVLLILVQYHSIFLQSWFV